MSEGVKMHLVEFFRCAKFSFWHNNHGVSSLTNPGEKALPLKMLYYITDTKGETKSLWIATSEGEESVLFYI